MATIIKDLKDLDKTKIIDAAFNNAARKSYSTPVSIQDDAQVLTFLQRVLTLLRSGDIQSACTLLGNMRANPSIRLATGKSLVKELKNKRATLKAHKVLMEQEDNPFFPEGKVQSRKNHAMTIAWFQDTWDYFQKKLNKDSEKTEYGISASLLGIISDSSEKEDDEEEQNQQKDDVSLEEVEAAFLQQAQDWKSKKGEPKQERKPVKEVKHRATFKSLLQGAEDEYEVLEEIATPHTASINAIVRLANKANGQPPVFHRNTLTPVNIHSIGGGLFTVKATLVISDSLKKVEVLSKKLKKQVLDLPIHGIKPSKYNLVIRLLMTDGQIVELQKLSSIEQISIPN